MFLMLLFAGIVTKAQDIVVITQGNFIRGTIQATNYATVILKNDDESIVQYRAEDIKEFVWNGETYVSKPIVLKKKMEHRFFKLIEQGAVNLYSIGGSTGIEPAQPKRSRIRPSFGIGAGTGGYSGVGMGGGITIGGGGGRNQDEQVKRVMPSSYFIEKFGTGPMMEVPVEASNSDSKNQHIRNVLLQKLTNDDDLAERIKATETFDAKLVRAFVVAYNAVHK